MDCSLAKYTRHDGVLFGGSETAPTLGFASAYGESTAKAMMRSAWCIRRLTFELSGERRCGALAAWPMINSTATRPGCHAGASPLERRVRRLYGSSGATCGQLCNFLSALAASFEPSSAALVAQ